MKENCSILIYVRLYMIDVIAGVTIDKLDFLYLIYNMSFLIKKNY